MKSKLVLIGALTLAAIILMIVLFILAIIGAVNITDGCLYRYNFEDTGSESTFADLVDDSLGGAPSQVLDSGETSSNQAFSNSTSVTNSVILKANGNYTASGSGASSGLTLDPNAYGKWLNTNLRVSPGQKVKFKVKGEVSLCKSYVPSNNLQQISALDSSGKPLEIPRVSDKASSPVNLIFDAKTDEWRNIAQIFKNDHIIVSIHPDKKTGVANSGVYNDFNKQLDNADCSEGQREYSPICGRYSVFGSNATYVDKCEYVPECTQCNCSSVCQGWDAFGSCSMGYEDVCDWCGCYENVLGIAPEPYKNDGKYTSPWQSSLSLFTTNFDQNCGSNQVYVDGEWQDQKHFWFSADNAAALLYRFDNNEDPTNKKSLGGGYAYSQIISDQTSLPSGAGYKVIFDQVYSGGDVSYLQYGYLGLDSDFTDNTGGYVLNIKHTKCRRENGNSFDDTYVGRGKIQYIIGKNGADPNSSTSGLNIQNFVLNGNGSGSLTASDNDEGSVWIRIDNDPNDYPDSSGQYSVDYTTTINEGNFSEDILSRFVQGFKDKVHGVSKQIFKNMTCYRGTGGTGECTNFFNYVKGLLSLYIMIYGMLFLMGMVQISQTDLVMRVIKIGLVAGLLNGDTFDFFNEYIFDFITGFTDDIIANMSGFSIFSDSGSVSNPFDFMNEVMTKIFLSSTFTAQILSLLTMGINGVIYFILIIVCLGIVVIVLLRSMAVYLMAFMAIAVLIGLTPLFLTFILFERTFPLFDNWVKFTFRYMIEPVILLAGIIILTQLFTVYLDFVIGYSVCWKCALPVRIPFPDIAGVMPAFLEVDIFCFNWFSPWGFDHRSSQMGLNMQNIVALLMIAHCMWGYIDFSASMVQKLAGSAGGPSATAMGKSMSAPIEEAVLSKVGLDKSTRSQIQGMVKGRGGALEEIDGQTPLGVDRKDVKPGGGGSGGGSSSSDDGNSPNNKKGGEGNGAQAGGSEAAKGDEGGNNESTPSIPSPEGGSGESNSGGAASLAKSAASGAGSLAKSGSSEAASPTPPPASSGGSGGGQKPASSSAKSGGESANPPGGERAASSPSSDPKRKGVEGDPKQNPDGQSASGDAKNKPPRSGESPSDKREREGKGEREREGKGEREGEGKGESEREREREREREGERGVGSEDSSAKKDRPDAGLVDEKDSENRKIDDADSKKESHEDRRKIDPEEVNKENPDQEVESSKKNEEKPMDQKQNDGSEDPNQGEEK